MTEVEGASAMQGLSKEPAETPSGAPPRVLTARALLAAVLLMALTSLWEQQAGLVTLAAQIGMAVPPVPALLALLLLMGFQAATRRSPRLHLSRPEVLGVYAVVCLATVMCSGGGLRFFLPSVTCLPYFASVENHYGGMLDSLPTWYAIHDYEVARTYFEGADGAVIPWAAWAQVLGVWGGYFLVFMTGLLCLAAVFLRSWTQDERLRYPIVELPLEMAGAAPRLAERPPLFRDAWLWIGVGLSGLFNLLNVLHCFNPSVPSLPQSIPLRAVFNEGPLRNIWWLDLQIMPVIFGLAYLMPTQILSSQLVFVGLALAECVVLDLVGYRVAGAPYETEQYAGAHIALALGLLFASRKRLVAAVRGWFRPAARAESRPESLALAGFLLCALLVMGFHRAAGLPLGLVLSFYGLLFTFALVSMRIRAEVGNPTAWLQPLEAALYLPLAPRGSVAFSPRALTVLASMTFLCRGYFPVFAGYEIEGLELGRRLGIRLPDMVRILTLAALLGFTFGIWLHLDAAYEYGSNVLEGGTTQGGYRVELSLKNYNLVSNALDSPYPAAPVKLWMALLGFAQAGLLVLLRRLFVGFPLHPIGFALGIYWTRQNYAMIGLAWLCKTSILKLGGLRAYHRLLPLFLGIALGHAVLAGGVWALISTYGGEAFRGYVVWF